MRIYVINIRTAVKYLAILVLAVVLFIYAGFMGPKALGVFSADIRQAEGAGGSSGQKGDSANTGQNAVEHKHVKDLPIYSVETEGKKASITFDCAWGAEDIPDILETLQKEDVKATFFIVGQWAEKFPDIVKMISDAGHDIANHGYSHLRMGVLDNARTKSEITNCSEVLQQITGKKVDLFRPPYGDYSRNLVSTAQKLGHYTIQWNVDSLDWKPEISREEIISRVSRKLVPGSIILFHNDTKHTSEILDDVIKLMKDRNYELVPVSSLILRENFIIDYEGRQRPASNASK